METNLEDRLQSLEASAMEFQIEHGAKKAQLGQLNKEKEYYKKNLKRIQEDTLLVLGSEKVFKEVKEDLGQVGLNDVEDFLNKIVEGLPFPQRCKFMFDKKGEDTMIMQIYYPQQNSYRLLRKQNGTAMRQVISLIMSMLVVVLSGKARIFFVDEKLTGLDDAQMLEDVYGVLVELAELWNAQIFFVEQRSQVLDMDGIHRISLDYSPEHNETMVVEVV